MKRESHNSPKIYQMVDSLSLGGTERMSVNIANCLSEQGIESGLIVTRESGGLERYLSPLVDKSIFNKKGKLDVLSFFQILKLLRSKAPDVLHAHQTSIFWAVLLKKFMPNTKLIWHDHFGMSEELDKYPRKEMDLVMPFIDSIVTVNKKIEKYWKKRYPNKKKDIVYIENFSGKLNSVPHRKIDGVFKIIHIANFRRQKDQITLLNALVGLKEIIGEYKVYFLGEYVELDWFKSVEDEIARLGLQNNVEIVGPVENIAPYIELAHIGVLSSISEGLPVTLLEYGMGALPTIATDVGQCGDVLGDGKFGELVSPESPKELQDSIVKIFNNYPEAIEVGVKFQLHTEHNYGSVNFLKKYLPLSLPDFQPSKISLSKA
ncbi:glycosyltransferase [Algoriphagus sp. PAP.12]|uniref:glycosyltransferase n=1 Tax=Algoriphagus sp. PAP.12 TaxID=2996678 RepID=UPI00227B7750|nr:glycosyltransferase [Algoriphagus sp. PAP.12]